MDTSWQQAGFHVTYVGQSLGLHASGQDNDPSRGGTFAAEIVTIDEDSITFRFEGNGGLDGYAAAATYDLATRKRIGAYGHAILWVTEDDVARGSAIIGSKAAILIHSDGTVHQFETGGTSYFYDARTGLLSHIVGPEYGGAAVRI